MKRTDDRLLAATRYLYQCLVCLARRNRLGPSDLQGFIEGFEQTLTKSGYYGRRRR